VPVTGTDSVGEKVERGAYGGGKVSKVQKLEAEHAIWVASSWD